MSSTLTPKIYFVNFETEWQQSYKTRIGGEQALEKVSA